MLPDMRAVPQHMAMQPLQIQDSRKQLQQEEQQGWILGPAMQLRMGSTLLSPAQGAGQAACRGGQTAIQAGAAAGQ